MMSLLFFATFAAVLRDLCDQKASYREVRKGTAAKDAKNFK